MANLKPHKFTREDSIKGGKKASIIRLNMNGVNRTLQDYLHSEGEFSNSGFIDDLLSISPKDRLNFMIAYLPFERPKLQAIEQIVEISKSEKSKEDIEKEIFEILEVK